MRDRGDGSSILHTAHQTPRRVARVAALLLLALIAGTKADAADATIRPQDPLSNPGFVAFFNNDYDGAVAYFQKQVAASPNDAGEYNHLAQALLYRQLYRNGALESQLVSGNNPFLRSEKVKMPQGEKDRLLQYFDRAQQLGEAQIARDGRDAKAYYELSVTHGLRANFYFLVDKAWTDSLKQATAARKADEKVLELDPKFIDANLILGLYQYVVGSLPFYVRAVGFIGGFHGDRDEGIRRLELVAKNGTLNKYDAQILLAVLYRRENQPRKAIPLLETLAQTFPRNDLFRFEQIQMYSDLGDKKSAVAVLAIIESKRSAKVPGFAGIPAARIQYVAGNLNFWYGDIPAALSNFRVATSGAGELDLNMAVLAWLRLGQVHDLQGHRQDARVAYEQTMRTAPESEAASEAKNYISKPYKRKQKNS